MFFDILSLLKSYIHFCCGYVYQKEGAKILDLAFLINEIQTDVMEDPFCPYLNVSCMYPENYQNMSKIHEHFNEAHFPEVFDMAAFNKKCYKCFFGPIDSEEEYLTHIAHISV